MESIKTGHGPHVWGNYFANRYSYSTFLKNSACLIMSRQLIHMYKLKNNSNYWNSMQRQGKNRYTILSLHHKKMQECFSWCLLLINASRPSFTFISCSGKGGSNVATPQAKRSAKKSSPQQLMTPDMFAAILVQLVLFTEFDAHTFHLQKIAVQIEYSFKLSMGATLGVTAKNSSSNRT